MSSGSFRINRVGVATLPDCVFFGFSVPKLLREFAIIVGRFMSFLENVEWVISNEPGGRGDVARLRFFGFSSPRLLREFAIIVGMSISFLENV